MTYYCNSCGKSTTLFFQKEVLIETSKGVILPLKLNVCRRCIMVPFVKELPDNS